MTTMDTSLRDRIAAIRAQRQPTEPVSPLRERIAAVRAQREQPGRVVMREEEPSAPVRADTRPSAPVQPVYSGPSMGPLPAGRAVEPLTPWQSMDPYRAQMLQDQTGGQAGRVAAQAGRLGPTVATAFRMGVDAIAPGAGTLLAGLAGETVEGAVQGFTGMYPPGAPGGEDARAFGKNLTPTGPGGFVGNVAGGLVGGLTNPGEYPNYLLGGVAGRGAMLAAKPLLSKIASGAGQKVANVLANVIDEAGEEGATSALQAAGQVTDEQWRTDPVGSAMFVLKSAMVGAGLGGAMGGVAGGTKTPHSRMPEPPAIEAQQGEPSAPIPPGGEPAAPASVVNVEPPPAVQQEVPPAPANPRDFEVGEPTPPVTESPRPPEEVELVGGQLGENQEVVQQPVHTPDLTALPADEVRRIAKAEGVLAGPKSKAAMVERIRNKRKDAKISATERNAQEPKTPDQKRADTIAFVRANAADELSYVHGDPESQVQRVADLIDKRTTITGNRKAATEQVFTELARGKYNGEMGGEALQEVGSALLRKHRQKQANAQANPEVPAGEGAAGGVAAAVPAPDPRAEVGVRPAEAKAKAVDLGGMGSGIADAFYDGVWESLKTTGKVPSPERKTAFGKTAQAAFDAGRIKGPGDIKGLSSPAEAAKGAEAVRQPEKPRRMDGTTRPERPAAKLPPEYEALHPKSREKFEAAWDAKDAKGMAALLDPANKGLRAEFERRAGVKLPKTIKGTDEAIRAGFASPDSDLATVPGVRSDQPVGVPRRIDAPAAATNAPAESVGQGQVVTQDNVATGKRAGKAKEQAVKGRGLSKPKMADKINELANRYGYDAVHAGRESTMNEDGSTGADPSGTFTFYKKLPTELKDALSTKLHLRQYFRVSDTTQGANGADYMGRVGPERMVEEAEAMHGAPTRLQIEYLEKSGAGRLDSNVQFWIDLHHRMETEPGTLRTPKENLKTPGLLPVGTTMKIGGETYTVKLDAKGEKVLEDGATYDHFAYFDDFPIDKGSLVRGDGKPLYAAGVTPDESPTAGMKATPRDLLGNPMLDAATGKQEWMEFETKSRARTTKPDRGEEDADMERAFDEEATEPLPYEGDFKGDGAAPFSAGHPLGAPPGAKWKRSGTARIDVAPMPGGTRPIKDITLDLEKSVGKVRTAKAGKWLGVYVPSSERTVIKYAGDLDTTAHEVAHRMDDLYGIVKKWAGKRQRSPFDGELIPHFSQYGSSTKTGPRSKLSYMRAEGVAEWMRAWMVNPDEAVKAAPQFAKHFETMVPAKVRGELRSFGDDIRRFAGDESAAQTAANVKMGTVADSPAAKMRAVFESEGVGGDFATKLRRVAVDAMEPVWKGVKLAKDLRGISDLLPHSDPKRLVRLFAGVDKKVMRWMSDGPTDAQGKRLAGVGGIDWLMEPIKSEQDLTDAISLGISQRVLERVNAVMADAGDAAAKAKTPADAKAIMDAAAARVAQMRISGAGAGVFSDMAVAHQAIADIAKDPARAMRASEAVRRYRQFADASLTYARDKGLISAERYKEIKDANFFYMAMKREMDEIIPGFSFSGGRALGASKKVIQRFKGSTRQIENPYAMLIAQTQAMVREADRNEAMLAFVRLLDKPRGMHQGKPIDLDQIGSRAKSGDQEAIKVIRAGKPEYWQFAPGIHKALKGFGDQTPDHVLLRVAQLPAKIARTFITHGPAFITRNVVRDSMARSVLSRSGAKPWDSLFFLTPGGRAEFRTLLAKMESIGGGQFGHFGVGKDSYYKAMREALNEATGKGKTIWTFPARAVDAYSRFGALMESQGRVAEFKRAYEKAKAKPGYSDLDAMIDAASESRDLQDFAVAGTAIRQINKYIPFTSAAVRAVARTGTGLAENPKGFVAKWMAYVVTMEMMNYGYNWLSGDDDEQREQPTYLRDFFWTYKLAPDLWLRIPKPWEMGVAASGIARAIDAVRGVKRPFEGWGGSVLKGSLPLGFDDAALGPFQMIAKEITNYDTFKNRPIVSPYEADLALPLRKGTKNASRVGQIVQDVLGVDSRKIDHFVRNQFGSIGGSVLSLSDIGRDDKPTAGRRLFDETVGFTTASPGPFSLDAVWLSKYAKSRGETSKPWYKSLRRLEDRYYDLPSGSERDAVAKRVREVAGQLRDRLDSH